MIITSAGRIMTTTIMDPEKASLEEMNSTSILLTLISIFAAWGSSGAAIPAFAADAKSKYGTAATRLTHSHEFFRMNEAPDFWALMPYYVHQQTESACSIASVTMVMNAIRAPKDLGSEEPLLTQTSLLELTKSENWKNAVGPHGRGVSLDQLGQLVETSVKSLGYANAQVTVVHADNTSKESLVSLRKALVENEKSANDFIILNFIQGAYTGDANVGHIAPLAAYDSKNKRALVLDPDRQWYEPYWVGDETLLSGMATRDTSASKSRGYVWVKLSK